MPPLDPTSLSLAARRLRQHLATHLGLPQQQIFIGHPTVGAKEAEDESDKQFLNLFFYRIEYGGYPPDGTNADPFYVRLYCLITALGNETSIPGGKISPGENDLRLIGGVMDALHKTPTIAIQNGASQPVAQLQVVPIPFSPEDINNIWTNQQEHPYRPSVAYELALAPIPLARAVDRSPRVGRIGAEVAADLSYEPLPQEGFSVTTSPPGVPRISVEAARPDWVPHICFVRSDGTVQYTLSFALSALPAHVNVIGIGKAGTTVNLRWEKWDSAGGWRILTLTPVPTLSIQTSTLDPESFHPGWAQAVSLPVSAAGQALLRAVRSWTRPDGTSVDLRSNPLLISIHTGGSP